MPALISCWISSTVLKSLFFELSAVKLSGTKALLPPLDVADDEEEDLNLVDDELETPPSFLNSFEDG